MLKDTNHYKQSVLFDKFGYITLKDYVEDIKHMDNNGPWKLPFGFMDRINFYFLSFFVRFSWFSDRLYILHESNLSPAYSLIFSFLRGKKIVGHVIQKNKKHNIFFDFAIKKDIFVNEYNVSLSGEGVSKSKSEAFSIAMGEIIERMVSGLFDMNKKIVSKSFYDISSKNNVLYPPRYHHFLDVQKNSYRELDNNPNNSIDWVIGKNLITKKSVYIPRQMTSWFGFGNSRVFKEKLIDGTSNGCAGYFTRNGSILRGLFEVVNRDGFLVYWLTKISPNIISKESLPIEIQETLKFFDLQEISIYILDITSLSIPSVYVVAINEKSKIQQVVLSGSSALTFEKAIKDSLKEMIMMSELFEGLESKTYVKKNTILKPFISDINKNTRQDYWVGDEEKINKFKWFISGDEVSYKNIIKKDLTSSLDESLQLSACLEILKDLGEDYFPVIYCPVNEIQERLGFYVTQVYIPKAFPLYLNECYGTFGSDRLVDFALSKNIKDWKLNDLPHMFS